MLLCPCYAYRMPGWEYISFVVVVVPLILLIAAPFVWRYSRILFAVLVLSVYPIVVLFEEAFYTVIARTPWADLSPAAGRVIGLGGYGLALQQFFGSILLAATTTLFFVAWVIIAFLRFQKMRESAKNETGQG